MWHAKRCVQFVVDQRILQEGESEKCECNYYFICISFAIYVTDGRANKSSGGLLLLLHAIPQ